MSNINASKASSPPSSFSQVRGKFDAQDSDILLQCTSRQGDPMKENYGLVFKAHRQKLAAASTVFEDMLDLSNPCSEDSPDHQQKLPTVKLEEDWLVVFILLECAYNKPEVLALLRPGAQWNLLLDLYNAANKYQFNLVKLYTSNLLSASIPMIRKQEALKIYIRASIFDDSPLALQALPKAAKVPLAMLCTESLRLLPTLFLMQLIEQQHNDICSAIREIVRDCEAYKTSASVMQLLPKINKLDNLVRGRG